MSVDFCGTKTRRFPIGLGIRRVRVDDAARTLEVLMTEAIRPGDLQPSHFRVLGGERVDDVHVTAVNAVGSGRTRQFRLALDRLGDFSGYRLQLLRGVADPTMPDVDPVWSEANFRFHQACQDEGDCAKGPTPQRVDEAESPLQDREGKDFAAFKRFMEERLAARVQSWGDRSPADHAEMLIELVSHVADELSYAQDRVLQEAYLPSARHRWSIDRHARLLDYAPSEGQSARTVLTVSWSGSTPTRLEPQTAVTIDDDNPAADPVIFETEEGLLVDEEWNELEPARDLMAPGEFDVRQGEILLEGHVDWTEPRWVVFDDDYNRVAARVDVSEPRILRLRTESSPTPVAREVTLLRWSKMWPESAAFDTERLRLHANSVMATHGVTREVVGTVVAGRLESASPRPISRPVGVSGEAQQPEINLEVRGVEYERVDRLVESGPFDQHFETVTGADGRVTLSFGDGEYGADVADGTPVRGALRGGVGQRGNVGRHALTEFQQLAGGIDTSNIEVDNLLPARGGRDQEDKASITSGVAAHLRTRHRAVTLEDYRDDANAVEGVRQAAAVTRWTGSWNTIFVYVLPDGGFQPAEELVERVQAELDARRMATQPLCVAAPRLSPLRLELTVCLEPSVRREAAREAILSTLFGGASSAAPLALSNLIMGGEVSWSRIAAAIDDVQGVRWARVDALSRLYAAESSVDTGACGLLRAEALEVFKIVPDPADREEGVLDIRFSTGPASDRKSSCLRSQS
ncbi:MAG: baseplate J/gp47 family protein [Myxococcota bacterium]